MDELRISKGIARWTDTFTPPTEPYGADPLVQVDTPTILPAAGTYYSVQTISMSCTTPDAEIHYTTNGDTPNAGSTLYTTSFQVATSTLVKAIGIKDGMSDSNVQSNQYGIEASPILCWQYTAKHSNGRSFNLNGPGAFPRQLKVPATIDRSTGILIDNGQLIDPSNYAIL
jgi:hypothetical protein